MEFKEQVSPITLFLDEASPNDHLPLIVFFASSVVWLAKAPVAFNVKTTSVSEITSVTMTSSIISGSITSKILSSDEQLIISKEDKNSNAIYFFITVIFI